MVFPFDSSLYSPIVEELDRGTESVWAVVRCSFYGIEQPDIRLLANLIHHLAGARETIPITTSILNRYREDETEIYLIELHAAGLQAGEYFLYLFAEDTQTKSRSRANTTFRVK